LWASTVVSSRLMEYELWVAIQDRGLAETHGDLVRGLVGRVAILELAAPVLVRALDPFPVRVRTLDALHLASADFLRRQKQEVRLATYDDRMRVAAERMGFDIPDYCRPIATRP
jgi:hypothetical protein